MFGARSYGYGSYGICIDPGFDRRILPYLDRGVTYVIAHIRGGGEMGRSWYEEQGKRLCLAWRARTRWPRCALLALAPPAAMLVSELGLESRSRQELTNNTLPK